MSHRFPRAKIGMVLILSKISLLMESLHFHLSVLNGERLVFKRSEIISA